MGLGNKIKNIYHVLSHNCVAWQPVKTKDKEIIFSVYFKGGQSREIKRRIIQRYNLSIKDFQANFNYSLAHICVLAIKNEPKLQKSIGTVKQIRAVISLDRKIPVQYSREYFKYNLLLIFFDLNYVGNLVKTYMKFGFNNKKAFREFGSRFKEALSLALEPKKITSSPLIKVPKAELRRIMNELNKINTELIMLLSNFIFSCWDIGLKSFNRHENKEIEIDCGHFLSFREGFSSLKLYAKEGPNDREFLQRIDIKKNKGNAEKDSEKIGLAICTISCLSYMLSINRGSDAILSVNETNYGIIGIGHLFAERRAFSLSPINKEVHSWVCRSVKQRGPENFLKDYHEACDILGIADENRIMPYKLSQKIAEIINNL